MSTGNWADRTDIFQACVNFLPLYLACPTAALFDRLLFSFSSPEILFPDIFSFYNLVLKKTQSDLSHTPLYSLTFNICVQISHFQRCTEGNFKRQCGPEAVQPARGEGGWTSVPAELPRKPPLENYFVPF